MIKKNSLITGLVVGVILALGFFSGFFISWRESLTDLLFTKTEPSQDVVIVAIDEKSLNSIGQWPWPRKFFAQVLARLQSARAIGVDINFKEESRFGEEDDVELSLALRKSKIPVVLSAPIGDQGVIEYPRDKFKLAAMSGYTNVEIKYGSIARKVSMSNGQIESFSKTLAKLYGPQGSRVLAVTDSFRIYYFGRSGIFPVHSFKDVLDEKVPKTFFDNKIVLIGVTAPDLHDFHQTPVGILSGVEIQANAVSTLLADKLLRSSAVLNLALIFILAIIGSLLSSKIKKLHLLLSALFGVFIFYNLIVFIAFDNFFILDLFYPNLAFIFSSTLTIIWQYARTYREKKFIQESFSRYLAPEVIGELLKDSSKLRLGGENKELTVLFSDIRDFTAISEGLDPEKLTIFLNRYFTVMTDIILQSGGVIDKYIGDAIMAFWGAPISKPNHAVSAVRAVLKMDQALGMLNQRNKVEGYPEIKVGIGINTGAVTVGNLGSEKRFDYTIIGDPVNLASRLEGLNKQYKTGILISESTRKQIRGIEDEFLIREIDRVQVKGKSEAVRIYEIVPERKREKVGRSLNEFQNGLEAYYKGDWQKAIRFFDQVLSKNPEDEPAMVLKIRCQSPPQNWNGVFILSEK